MCFNLAASLIAGTIGMTAAAVIRGGLGAFIAYYTLIQFAEAGEYAGYNLRRTIHVLLSTQLAFFTVATWQPTPLYNALAVGGVVSAIAGAVSPIEEDEKLPQYGVGKRLGAVMTAEYAGIFLGMLSQPKLRGAASVLGATAVASLLARPQWHRDGAPSLWCFLSAVGAPLMLGQGK